MVKFIKASRRILIGSAIMVAFAASLNAQTLSPDIQADRHMLAATTAMEAGDHWTAVDSFEQVILLDVNLPSTFWFQYSDSLQKISRFEDSKDALILYLSEVGKQGEYYDEALEKFNTLESEIKRQKANEKQRRLDAEEAARVKAHEDALAAERRRIAAEEKRIADAIVKDAEDFENKIATQTRLRERNQKALSDQVGNVMWEKSYPLGPDIEIFSMAALENDTIIVGGGSNDEKGHFIGIDKNGTELWNRTPDAFRWISYLAPAKDGNFFAGAGHPKKYVIAKYNAATGKKIWKEKISSDEDITYYRITNIMEVPTGDVIFIGQIKSPGNNNRLEVIVLSPEGDKKWSERIECDTADTVDTQLLKVNSQQLILTSFDCNRARDGKKRFYVIDLEQETATSKILSANHLSLFVTGDGKVVERVTGSMDVSKTYMKDGKTIQKKTKVVAANRVFDQNFNQRRIVTYDDFPSEGLAYSTPDGGVLIQSSDRVQRLDRNGEQLWQKSYARLKYQPQSFPVFLSDQSGVILDKGQRIVRIENLSLK